MIFLYICPVFQNQLAVALPGDDLENTVVITADSLKRLFLLYGERVYAVCYTHTGNMQEAQDMVQDIFKSLWERRHDLQITSSIEHYLLRAARLRVMEYIRNHTIRRQKLMEAFTAEPSQSNSTEDHISLNDRFQELHGLIERLPPQTREIFRLSRVSGRNNREIARLLSLSEKAVEYHITKSLKFLKSSLG